MVVNHAPTDISLGNSSVDENQPAGTAVGLFSATDPDPGDSFSFALVLGIGAIDNGSFQIDGSTLRTSQSFDYETKNSVSSAITVRAEHGVFAGEIAFNTVGTQGVQDSGSLMGADIALSAEDNAQVMVAIVGNSLYEYGGPSGIAVRAQNGAPRVDATILDNWIADPATSALNGLFVQNGGVAGHFGAMCADIRDNSLTGSGANGATDFQLRQLNAITVRLPGYSGAPSDTAAVVSFVKANNGGTPIGSAIAAYPASGGGFVAGPTSCRLS